MKQRKNQKGFTLVELAIVLVIIGLIIGGVLVGQDLIKSAEIRSTIQFVEQTNAAVNTFRGKYSGLPGDLLFSRATQFDFTPSAGTTAGNRTGANGVGDADGLIENGTGAQGVTSGLGNETLAFWGDLTQAGLIPTSVAVPGATGMTPAAYTTGALILGAGVVPASKVRETTFYHTYAFNGRNYFYLGGASAVAASGAITPVDGLTPQEAFSIDEKMDDGDGDSGTVLAINDFSHAEATNNGGTAGDCFDNADGIYNADDTNGTVISCRLSIRSSF